MTKTDAIHSGKSRGRVCGSEFHGKTVKNGGWNRVGLWLKEVDYTLSSSYLAQLS